MQPESIKLTPEQIDAQVQTICRFLSAVHPSLIRESDDFRPCVEIRPIPRGKKEYMLTRSLNIWDLSEETKSRLRTFLERHNGQPDCIYYSVFTYDNFKKTLTKRGTEAKPGKITVSSALDTSEIALDFDSIDFEGYTSLVDRFEEMGIHALWVFTGHGYQAHILLNEPLRDKDILRRFVYLARSKGFFSDPACVDPARIMRLPGTYNCKCFSEESYAAERDNPPFCEIMQETDARYSLEDVIEAFSLLPTVSEDDEAAYLNTSKSEKESASEAPAKKDPEKKASKKENAKEMEATEESSVQVTQITYPYIQEFDLPDAITRMLSYTPDGFRNNVLGFLIRYFTKQYRLGKAAIFEILTVWAREACDPSYEEETFKEDFERLYQYNGLSYNTALSKQFGNIDFNDLIQLRKKDIFVPHKFFKAIGDVSGQAVRMYLGIKMLEHTEEPCTKESIANLLGLSVRAVTPTLTELVDHHFVYVREGNRRRKIPNTYHTDRFNTRENGFTPFSYNDIKAYVSELYEPGSRGNGELKLYLFMRWKFYSGDIYMSQTNLGKNLGLAQNSISVIVNRLQERHFLKIKKIFRYGMESCEYTLLR